MKKQYKHLIFGLLLTLFSYFCAHESITNGSTAVWLVMASFVTGFTGGIMTIVSLVYIDDKYY